MISQELINYNESINIPDHLIAGVDSNYISKRHDIFYLKKECSIYVDNDFIILNNKNKELYNLSFTKNKSIVYDKRRIPIIQTDNKYSNRYIYLGGDNDTISIIRYKKQIDTLKHVFTDYEVEFVNLMSSNQEYLTVSYNRISDKYSVYCNKDKENETVICVFGKAHDPDSLNTNDPYYFIEVSPWVDYMHMIGICLCFISLYNNK